MATTFITAPSSATPGTAASLQNLSASSSLRPHHSSATTITATANVIERGSSLASRNNQQSSYVASHPQFSISAKSEVPDESGAMITLQGGGSSNDSSSSVQYLTDGEQIYATTNGQLRQYSPYVADSSASPANNAVSGTGTSSSASSATTTYYDASGLQVVQQTGRSGGGNSSVAGKIVQNNQLAGLASGMQGQLVTHQGSTYILQTPSSTVLNDADNSIPLQHVTRASPATVQWLLEHFEPSEGVSLARCTLYSHYRRHCAENRVDEMNAASFGKLIRSVFVNLKTRRLGTRGNSKYHYYGIRVKPNSPLNQYNEEAYAPMNPAARGGGAAAFQGSGASATKKFRSNEDGSYSAEGQANEQQNQQYYASNAGAQAYQQMDATQQARLQEHLQYLGDPSLALTEFPGILSGNVKTTERQIELPEGISVDDLLTFESLYKEHCESILDIVVNLQFSLLESLWSSFWKRDDDGEDEMEDQLPKYKLGLLCKMELIQSYMRQCDHVFYQSLVEVLIPDVLRPIPSSLTQAIRNFAKSLDGWATSTLNELPEPAYRVKYAAINAFSQTLRRYTSLNHLAQAARAVLQNNGQIAQMLSDLNRVDFASVQEQAAWVCQCEDTLVASLEKNFKMTLQAGTSLEDWAAWLESVVDQVLKSHQGSPNFAKAARQFLLKWSFYSSMVIRDLTLRSAASFGSFHLIRLLYDEYMFFLIEHKVAQSLGETPIGVMGNGSGVGVGDASIVAAMSGDAGSGYDEIDLPSTAPTAQEVSLPRDGASIDAMLIDHEMLTKPNFDISTDSGSSVRSVPSKTELASNATSAKLHSIPVSATININNNNNANSLTSQLGSDLVELQTEYGTNALLQAATSAAMAGGQMIGEDESADTKISVSTNKSVETPDKNSSSSTSSLSSSSTTSLQSSSSIISLNASVGVIKQAGSVVASATIVEDSDQVARNKGQTFVVVANSSQTVPKNATAASSEVAKSDTEDIDAPAAKRAKTQ